ncbi:MAG: hypothetical protein ACRDL5_18810 [Solirubrobacteraceae bacterium]
MSKGPSWLSITPEPERELPAAVATLSAGRLASAEQVRAQSTRIERLVLRGSRRRWLAYLHEVVELVERRRPDSDPDVIAARGQASAVIVNHHNLMLGLPGTGARLTAQDRVRLQAMLSTGGPGGNAGPSEP